MGGSSFFSLSLSHGFRIGIFCECDLVGVGTCFDWTCFWIVGLVKLGVGVGVGIKERRMGRMNCESRE